MLAFAVALSLFSFQVVVTGFFLAIGYYLGKGVISFLREKWYLWQERKSQEEVSK